MFLMATITMAVFAVMLSAKTSVKKSGRKVQALFYTRQAMEKLKAYVTGDPVDPSVTGPGGAAPGGWHIPEDTACIPVTDVRCSAAPACVDCAAGAWALLDGCDHDLSSMIPLDCNAVVSFCRNWPVCARLRYRVTNLDVDPNCGPAVTGPIPCKQVAFTIDYDDPL